MRRCLILLVSCLSWATTPDITIPRVATPPSLSDFTGMEPATALAKSMTEVTGFVQRQPRDGDPPSFKTRVFLGYDEKHVYAVFLAYDDEPDKIRAHMAPRGNVFNDDTVNIQIDTFNDQRRGYTFASNPMGIQWDALYTEGQGFDSSYQSVWFSDAEITDRGFMVYFRIPFTSLRFPDREMQTWRIMLNRQIARLNEESFWPGYSIAILGRLNQAAVATGVENISAGRNIQFNPYGFARGFRALDPDTATFNDNDFDPEVGLDAKFVIRDAFVLDVTANPDFSQIESDQPQVTVNQRFEVFFPERRPFFLENADIFSTPVNLVFTRRIVDPNGGLKFTGKSGDWSVGAMVIDDDAPGQNRADDDPLKDERADIQILRLQRDLSSQSTLGLLFTNREFGDDYNRIIGLDSRIRMSPNWETVAQGAFADTREGGVEREGSTYNVAVNRSGRHLSLHNHFIRTSPDFRTRLGFLRGEQRPDVLNLHQRTGYTFRPEKGKLVEWGPALRIGRAWDTEDQRLDTFYDPSIEFEWSRDESLEFSYNFNEQRLEPEDFSNLPIARDFPERNYEIEWSSRKLSSFSYEVEVGWGRAINFGPAEGKEIELVNSKSLELSLTARPLPPLRIDGSYFFTELEDRDSGALVFRNQIARLQGNWQFTRELSVRTIFQMDRTTPNEEFSRLERERNLNTDLLVRYLINPWSAIYLGYNQNQSNFEIVDDFDGSQVVRTRSDLKQDGRQFFLKVSWLFQY